jgi:hypothetical protein
MKTEKPFDPTKPYRTRDGREAKIVHTFKDGHLLVIVDNKECHHTHDGRLLWCSTKDNILDLVNIPEKKTIEFWVFTRSGQAVAINSTGEFREFVKQEGDSVLHFTREYEEGEGL